MKKSLKASAKKVKPVKGWAIVDRYGDVVSVGLREKDAWNVEQLHAFEPKLRDRLWNEWYNHRCIRVTITPAA